MGTLSIIDVILIFFGCAHAALMTILYILSLSTAEGTTMSKKMGNTNDKADEYFEKGKSMSNDVLKKRFGERQWVV